MSCAWWPRPYFSTAKQYPLTDDAILKSPSCYSSRHGNLWSGSGSDPRRAVRLGHQVPSDVWCLAWRRRTRGTEPADTRPRQLRRTCPAYPAAHRVAGGLGRQPDRDQRLAADLDRRPGDASVWHAGPGQLATAVRVSWRIHDSNSVRSRGDRCSAASSLPDRLHGFSFPRYRGGLMYWADEIGVKAVYAQIASWHQQYGERWAPSRLLRELAESGTPLREAKPAPFA